MNVLILYHSKTGHTLEAVNAMANGIRSAGSEADIVPATDFDANALSNYDGFVFGSPCWAGSITGSGIATPIKEVVNSLPARCLEKKRCGGISVCSAAGGANTVTALGKLLSQKGCGDFRPGPSARAGVAFSLWKGPSVSEQDGERFKAYGAQFVA